MKLLDFGIAKSSAAMLETQAGVLKGKVGYMAPEQASMRDLDGSADVFSMGVILWEAIAGRRLTEGVSSQEVLLRRCEGTDPRIVEVVPDVDPELGEIVDRAMAFLPEDRYRSAAELQSALEGWLTGRTQASRKDLARSVREAFIAEREHLRSIVEQRMADSSLSGMRQALSVTSTGGLPSLGRLHGTGDGPAMTPRRAGPISAPISLSATGPHHPQQVSVPTATEVMTPPPRKQSSPMLFVAIGAVAVLGLIGASVAIKIATTKDPTPLGTTDTPASTNPAADPSMPTTAGTTTAATTGATGTTTSSSTTPQTTPQPWRGKPPPFVPPAKVTPPVPHPPTGATTSAPPSGLTPPTPKQPSRPLDEKDPYAP